MDANQPLAIQNENTDMEIYSRYIKANFVDWVHTCVYEYSNWKKKMISWMKKLRPKM